MKLGSACTFSSSSLLPSLPPLPPSLIPPSLGAIADLDLVIRSKKIEDDIMVVCFNVHLARDSTIIWPHPSGVR